MRRPVLFLLGVIVLLSSCTLWKRSERQTTLDSHTRSMSVQDSSGWSLAQFGRVLRFSRSGLRVLILPRGPVRYHPDSGFAGEAGYLLLDSYHRSTTTRQDSLRLEAAHMQRSDSLDTRLHHSDRRQREKDVRPGWRLPWWGWGVLLLGLLVLVWRIGARWIR